MIEISELEEDILKEFFNMGLGMAADALSAMVNKEVLLSLPNLALVTPPRVMELVEGCPEETMVAIRLRFRSDLEGTALLLFPGARSLELVRALLNEEVALEMLGELEQETLLDMGNVLLNAFLTSFTQMMSMDFSFDAAEFLRASCATLLDFKAHFQSAGHKTTDEEVQQAIVLIMHFATEGAEESGTSLQGYMVLLFSPRSLEILKEELGRILRAMS